MTTMAHPTGQHPYALKCDALQPVQTVHENPWFTVRNRGGYFSIEHNRPQVTVLPIVDQRAVVMVWAKRPLLGGVALELPAGGVQEHESPREAAARELVEETGIAVEEEGRFSPLPAIYITPRSPDPPLVFHVAVSGEQFKERAAHDDEVSGVECLLFAETLRRIETGDIQGSLAIAILMRYLLHEGVWSPR